MVHPLVEQSNLVKERHIAVFEHVNSLPRIKEPWVSPEFVIVICKNGWLKGRYDMRPINFKKNDIVFVYPDHAIVPKSWSDDYDVTLIVASTEWANQQHLAFPLHNVLTHVLYPEFHLTDEQIEVVDRMVQVIKDISALEDVKVRDQLLRHQMDNLVRLLDHFRSKEVKTDFEQLSNVKQIAYRFYEDLVHNYKISRGTKFYAAKQNLTAKYFGTTIYDVTGIHVSDWVGRYIVTKAKMMLQSRPDLTVAQIGSMLGFDSPSDFGRYFKRHANTSPAAYREEVLEENP